MTFESPEAMREAIVNNLTVQLKSDATFNDELLAVKVSDAYDEVQMARHYPNTYDDDMIFADMQKFYTQIKNIALYDYNQIGAEFEQSHSENGVSRTYRDRDKLFTGVIPLAVL